MPAFDIRATYGFFNRWRDIPRWVRKGQAIYDHSNCCLCGTGWGGGRASEGDACAATRCIACGSDQCTVNGLSRGQCGVCLVGLLPGWGGTDRPCGYAKCKEKAVMAAPRVGYACMTHAEEKGLMDVVRKRLAEREKLFELRGGTA